MSNNNGKLPPQVSIVTPAYNVEKYIDQTIESVVRQTFADWEMLIVNDGSDDKTSVHIARWIELDARIQLIESPSNEGPGPARNHAVKKAAGRYIAFLDADDVWYPEKLEQQLNFMQEMNAYFTYTAYEMVREMDDMTRRVVAAAERTSYESLLKDTSIGCLTVMIDSEKVDELTMPNIPVRQPLVLWLRLLRTYGPAHGMNKVLARHRVRRHSVSGNKQRAAIGVWRVYREYERLPLPSAMWYFLHYAVRGFLRNR